MIEYHSRELMGIPRILATPTLGRDDVTLIPAAFLSAFNLSFKAEQPTVNRLQTYRNRYLDKKKNVDTFQYKKTEESVQMLSLLIEMSLAAVVITAVSHWKTGKTS